MYMKRLISMIGLLVVVLSTSGCVAANNQVIPAPTYRKIAPTEAQAMMTDTAITLDVRTQSEYDEGHIAGAILLPDTEVAARAEELLSDKNQTILIYCRSGRRSANSAQVLVDMGFAKVYDFGGIIDFPGEVVKR